MDQDIPKDSGVFGASEESCLPKPCRRSDIKGKRNNPFANVPDYPYEEYDDINSVTLTSTTQPPTTTLYPAFLNAYVSHVNRRFNIDRCDNKVLFFAEDFDINTSAGSTLLSFSNGNKEYLAYIFDKPATYNFSISYNGVKTKEDPLLTAHVIICGGGGGGGLSSVGGGGGGGEVISKQVVLVPHSYDIIVGNSGQIGEEGNYSSFDRYYASGGGAGGNYSSAGTQGSNGGGSGGNSNTAGATSNITKIDYNYGGNSGGASLGTENSGGGGGGGATENGSDGYSIDTDPPSTVGGVGGKGVAIKIGEQTYLFGYGGDGGPLSQSSVPDSLKDTSYGAGGDANGMGGGGFAAVIIEQTSKMFDKPEFTVYNIDEKFRRVSIYIQESSNKNSLPSDTYYVLALKSVGSEFQYKNLSSHSLDTDFLSFTVPSNLGNLAEVKLLLISSNAGIVKTSDSVIIDFSPESALAQNGSIQYKPVFDEDTNIIAGFLVSINELSNSEIQKSIFTYSIAPNLSKASEYVFTPETTDEKILEFKHTDPETQKVSAFIPFSDFSKFADANLKVKQHTIDEDVSFNISIENPLSSLPNDCLPSIGKTFVHISCEDLFPDDPDFNQYVTVYRIYIELEEDGNGGFVNVPEDYTLFYAHFIPPKKGNKYGVNSHDISSITNLPNGVVGYKFYDMNNELNNAISITYPCNYTVGGDTCQSTDPDKNPDLCKSGCGDVNPDFKNKKIQGSIIKNCGYDNCTGDFGILDKVTVNIQWKDQKSDSWDKNGTFKYTQYLGKESVTNIKPGIDKIDFDFPLKFPTSWMNIIPPFVNCFVEFSCSSIVASSCDPDIPYTTTTTCDPNDPLCTTTPEPTTPPPEPEPPLPTLPPTEFYYAISIVCDENGDLSSVPFLVSSNDTPINIFNQAKEQSKNNESVVTVIADIDKGYSSTYNPSCEDLIAENPSIELILSGKGVSAPCTDCNPTTTTTTTTTCNPESPDCTTLEPDPSGCFFENQQDMLIEKDFLMCDDFIERGSETCPPDLGWTGDGSEQFCFYLLDSNKTLNGTEEIVEYSCCTQDKCNHYVLSCCPPDTAPIIIPNDDVELLLNDIKFHKDIKIHAGKTSTLICLPVINTTTTTTTTTCDPNDPLCTTTTTCDPLDPLCTTTTCDPNDPLCTNTTTTTLSPTTTINPDPCCELEQLSVDFGGGPFSPCDIVGLPSCFTDICSRDGFCQFIEVDCANAVDQDGFPVPFCECPCGDGGSTKCYAPLCTTTTTTTPEPTTTSDPTPTTTIEPTPCPPEDPLCGGNATTTPNLDPTTGPPACNPTWLAAGGACPPTTTTTCDPLVNQNCTTTTTTTCDPFDFCSDPPYNPDPPGTCNTFYRYIPDIQNVSACVDPMAHRVGSLGETKTLDNVNFSVDIYDESDNFLGGGFIDHRNSFELSGFFKDFVLNSEEYRLDCYLAYDRWCWEWMPFGGTLSFPEGVNIDSWGGPSTLWKYRSFHPYSPSQNGPNFRGETSTRPSYLIKTNGNSMVGGFSNLSHNNKCPASDKPEDRDACWQLNGQGSWLDKSFTRKAYFYSLLSDYQRCAPDPDVCNIWFDPLWKRFEISYNSCLNPSVAQWCYPNCWSFNVLVKDNPSPELDEYQNYNVLLDKDSIIDAGGDYNRILNNIQNYIGSADPAARDSAIGLLLQWGTVVDSCCFDKLCPDGPWCTFQGYGSKYEETVPNGMEVALVLNKLETDDSGLSSYEPVATNLLSFDADNMFCADEESELKTDNQQSIKVRFLSGHYKYPGDLPRQTAERMPRSSFLRKDWITFTHPGEIQCQAGTGKITFTFIPPLSTKCYNKGVKHDYKVRTNCHFTNYDDFNPKRPPPLKILAPMHPDSLEKTSFTLQHYAFLEVRVKDDKLSDLYNYYDYHLAPRDSKDPVSDSIYYLGRYSHRKTAQRDSYATVMRRLFTIPISVDYDSFVIVDMNIGSWVIFPYPPLQYDFADKYFTANIVAYDSTGEARSYVDTSFKFTDNNLP